MDTCQKQHELTDYARTLIHHKAQQIIGKAGLRQCDLDDIKQEFTLDLLERMPKFNPNKASYNTFVARVVNRKLSRLLRDRYMKRRDYRREQCSVNEYVDDGDDGWIERAATLSQDDQDRRTDKHVLPETERTDLQLDVAQMLSDLPPKLGRAAEMLTRMSVAEVARELGVPRSTFYDTYLAPLRQAFTASGMGEYVK